MNSINIKMSNILNIMKEKLSEFSIEYGILAVFATAAVPLKLLLFYNQIGVSTNFIIVWLITCILTYFLFSSFKNKWIPATIYLMLSILMFADVTYSSFFNRYLSVNMMGAAGFIGDITESIKEVLRPSFFLLLVDSLLVFAALIFKKAGLFISDRKDIMIGSTAEETEELIMENVFCVKEQFEEETDQKKKYIYNIRNSLIQIKNIIFNWLLKYKKPVIAICIIIILVCNLPGSFLITSISNQEIYSYHIKDIIGAFTGKGNINEGSEYMSSIKDSYSSEKNGPLFGVAKDRNLIVIQIESLQNFVINAEYNGQEITPNLNKLLRENTIYFDNYYQQIGSGNTSDAEFATNNSIYGSLSSYTYKLFADNYFRGLPVLLKDNGYETAVYHAHENRSFWNRETAYKSLGFDHYVGGIGGTAKGEFDMTEWMGWGLTDTEFFKQAMEYIKEMPQPFYSFIITLSNHHPYIMLDKYNFIEMLPEDEGTIFGNYLNSAAYTDYAIGQLFKQLKKEGLYDNSIIALYGDHLGLVKSDEEIFKSASKFLGKDYDFDTMMNIPLIISVPSAEKNINQTVSISGGQLDFLPTIAYLMGFDELDTTYLGHNLLTIKTGFVAEQTYMTKGSFFQDDIVYEMSRDGVFENGRAWNKKTGKPVPLDDCYEGYIRSMGIVNTSEYILKNDVLRKIYLEGEETVSAFSVSDTKEFPDTIALAGAPNKSLLRTNSLEALNASYDAGYRNIKVQTCWTEDKEAVLLNSWDKIDQYFDTNPKGELSIADFKKLKMKNGLTSMDCLDLIDWMKNHPDVTIIAQVERSADYFMKCMDGYSDSIFERFIVEVPGVVEYTGLYHSILNVDKSHNTANQLLDFIELNHVAAITMTSESAMGVYQKVLESDCIKYIEEVDNGLLTKRD